MSMHRNLIIANANVGATEDGRIFLLDALNNTGAGHNNSTTVWKNLAGSIDTTLSRASWGENYLITDGTVVGNTNFQVMPTAGDFTVEAVISHSSIVVDVYQFIMSQRTVGTGAAFGLYTNQVQFYMPIAPRLTSNFYPMVNQIYHALLTRTGNQMILYINGNLEAQVTNATTIPSENMSLLDYTDVYPFTGKMFLSGAYNRALSNAEILRNYNYYKARFNI